MLGFDKMIGWLIILLLARLSLSVEGNCEIAGVTENQWNNELILNITDTDFGTIWERTTSNTLSLLSIKEVLYILNNPPYVNATVQGGIFTIDLRDEFRNYEANETSLKMAYEFQFQCIVGVKRLTVVFNIRDTNNHRPVFLPTNSYNYSIQLPLPIGFPVSFSQDIIVRDDDLTNYGILPQIQPNDYFNLSYVDVDSTKKRHKLVLTAKKNIVDFESTVLIIGATDKDNTEYPSLTSFGELTITKSGDSGPGTYFEFEDPFYLGVFDNDKDIVEFTKTISLRGFNDEMTFSLAGNGSEYFNAIKIGNEVIITPSNTAIPESVILSPKTIVISLIAYLGQEKAETALSIELVKDPNCVFSDLPTTVWDTGLVLNMTDWETGDTIRTYSENIIEIIDFTYRDGELVDPPYVAPAQYRNRIDFEINNARYIHYEKNETRSDFTMYVNFKCKRNNRVLKVIHGIRDTNNHFPFLSSHMNNASYKIFTPIPANYSITKTYGELVITDYDLTNYAINATLSQNDYLDLKYRGPGKNKKEYVFDLITKVRIDTILSNIVLNVTFSDVDLTGQLPKSNSFLVTVTAN